MGIRVLLPQPILPAGYEYLREHGYEVVDGRGFTEDDIVADIADCDAIIVRTAKITKRINLFGALFLAVLATIPTLIYGIANVSLPFQASSLLIAVSVALETTRQLESQILMRHYKGFLK